MKFEGVGTGGWRKAVICEVQLNFRIKFIFYVIAMDFEVTEAHVRSALRKIVGLSLVSVLVDFLYENITPKLKISL